MRRHPKRHSAARRALVLRPEAVNRGEKRVVHSWVVDKVFGKWDKLLSSEQSHKGTPYLDGMRSYVTG